MNNLKEQYGFEATFISEVPEYPRCIVCHLVLREPVQIMQCGHRFCKPCFERIKGYSQNFNTSLCCPVDRGAIDLNKVFQDTGMERIIGNLQVSCVNKETGCVWTGDLRNVMVHEDHCEHAVEKVDPMALDDLCRRINKCEDAMMEKDKDIALLKHNLLELKKCVLEKDEEVNLLKVKNIDIENEMKLIKQNNQELKNHLEREIEVLSLKYQLMENKIDSFGNQLEESKKLLQEKQVEMITLKSEIEEMKNKEVKNLNNVVIVTKDEIMDHVDKSLNTTSDEINKLSAQLTFAEQTITDNFITLNDKIEKNTGEIKNNIDDAKANIEKIFCLSSYDKDVVLHWKLHNFQRLFEVREPVYSQEFYTEIKDWSFKLYVVWSGDKSESKKNNFGLFVQPYRDNKSVSLGNMMCSLQMVDINGIPFSKTVNDENIVYIVGQYGFLDFLKVDMLKKYIVDDMISIKCILTPKQI